MVNFTTSTTSTSYPYTQDNNDTNTFSNDIIRELPRIIYYGIIGFVTIITNGSLVYFIVSRRKLWKLQNAKLCSMSMCGILFALLFCIPYPLTVLHKTNLLCFLKHPFRNFFMSCICLHLALIAIDRAITIIRPLQYSKVVNRKYTFVTLLIIWIAALFGSFYPILTFRTQAKAFSQNLCPTSGKAADEFSYTIAFYCIYFLFPLLIMLICYGYILVIALRHVKKMNNHDIPNYNPLQNRKNILVAKRFKAAVPFLIITGTFIALTVPQIICSMISVILAPLSFDVRKSNFSLLIGCLKASNYGLRELAFSYPALNPLIYVYFSRDIRNEVTNKFNYSIAFIPRTAITAASIKIN